MPAVKLYTGSISTLIKCSVSMDPAPNDGLSAPEFHSKMALPARASTSPIEKKVLSSNATKPPGVPADGIERSCSGYLGGSGFGCGRVPLSYKS